MLNYTEFNDLLCSLEIIPSWVCTHGVRSFNWLGLAQGDASLDFYTKTMLVTGVTGTGNTEGCE